jgi:SRSO17 transposase
VTTRRYLDIYVEGQLGPLERKSIEPIADAAGEPPRNLQQFLSLFRWDQAEVRDRLQRRIAQTQADSNSVGVVDETTYVKKGDKTAGVQHQYCGAVGKQENCVMSVHLGYARPNGFHCLLDGELYLPQTTWDQDRSRCRRAGVPDDYVYRPKWKMALDQLARANANGVRMAWLTFDEAYGDVGDFRRALEERGQNYVGEVPTDFSVWTSPPHQLYRQHTRDAQARPWGRRQRRLKLKNNPRIQVRNLLKYSPVLRRAPWVKYRVKDGGKGPMIWEVKRIMVWGADAQGMPGAPYHLLVARNPLDPKKEVKFFISNAPPTTSVNTLLLVAFSRWHIERVFEDAKGELGMDHFEVRCFQAIQRHLILSSVSHLFLAEFQQKQRGEKPGPDYSTTAGGDRPTDAPLVLWGPLFVDPG